jgi:hypothetical protein
LKIKSAIRDKACKSSTVEARNLYRKLGLLSGLFYLLVGGTSAGNDVLQNSVSFDELSGQIADSMLSDHVSRQFVRATLAKNRDLDTILASANSPIINDLGQIFILSFAQTVTEFSIKSSSLRRGEKK